MQKINSFTASILILCFSCGNPTKEKSSEIVSKETNSITQKEENNRNQNFVFTKSILNDKKRLDDGLYREMLSKSKSINKPLPEYNKYEHYYTLDTIILNSIIVIPIIHKDESCCQHLYYLTFDKKERNLIDVKHIATSGSDGDWSETDKIYIEDNTHIRITKIITQQIMNNNNEYEKQIKDSITIIHRISDNGAISSQKTDSIRTSSLMK